MSLVLDAGTVDGTATAGLLTINITQTLNPGIYVLAAVNQGAPTTRPTVRYTGYAATGSFLMTSGYVSHTSAMTGTTVYGYVQATGVTGALGSSYSFDTSTTAPIIHLRTA